LFYIGLVRAYKNAKYCDTLYQEFLSIPIMINSLIYNNTQQSYITFLKIKVLQSNLVEEKIIFKSSLLKRKKVYFCSLKKVSTKAIIK